MNPRVEGNSRSWPWFAALLSACLLGPGYLKAADNSTNSLALLRYRLGTLERAVKDLELTYGAQYPRARQFLAQSHSLRERLNAGKGDLNSMATSFAALQQEALLANPLLQSNRLLVIKRRPTVKRGITPGLDIAMPSNHECNSSLTRTGYTNKLCILSPIAPDGELQPLYEAPHGGYVGEVDLHWQGDRVLFTQSDATNWKVFEMHIDGSGLRQVSTMPDDVDSFDASYLPNGKIIFGSTASFQAVPCWHGLKKVSNLYLMERDGTGVRQLCFDQDHDFHPTVLPNGQVLYHRWDYTGINHIYLRELMLMNPDGTGQRAIYGSGSWYPNALYFPRPLPGYPGKLLCILSGYHGVHRMGQLVILDTTKGWHEARGIVQRISGRGDPIKPIVKDNLVDADWPKFLHPFPLSDKYFLVAAWLGAKANWGIYLADVFDNLVLVREEPGWALLEPVLLKAQPRPAVIPDQVDLNRDDGLVYLHDVYAGPGLQGVPRGTIKSLRVLAYHFGYVGLAGPDRIGYGGPWEVMRILGTVPLEPDGSGFFRVPANTPIALQPLDNEGKAVQFMRSWFTVMPGEKTSCIGCHEAPSDTPRPQLALAANREPRDLMPWYGPSRGFDFEREVQPVLDRHCVRCHDGSTDRKLACTPPDLRSSKVVTNYAGLRISQMGIDRLHPKMRDDTQGVLKYSPAYDSLIHYIRRVGIEDDVSLLVPGEYHADTSPLIQMLRKGHQGVALDPESWDRLITWIDLNAPCHGTWGEVYPIPDGAHERRMALRNQCGGPRENPEAIPHVQVHLPPGDSPARKIDHPDVKPDCRIDPLVGAQTFRIIPLGNGITLKLVRIPAGEFMMGDSEGEPDENPLSRVRIPRPFWMAAHEISNEQFRLFDSSHDSRYYQKRYPPVESGAPTWLGPDALGLTLNADAQPVVRVSWNDALAFCRWLSEKTGLEFNLPSEAQWEWACRAGTRTPLHFGTGTTDFSPWANLADRSFSRGLGKDGKQLTGGLEHLVLEGAFLSETRFADGAIVTAMVGSYQPNGWGLHDMHGNASEWTRTPYSTYPYRDEEPATQASSSSLKVVRGGSFFDPPGRARSAFRLPYPSWQRVFNVGFRVVSEQE